ncbi:hypothetical protein E6C27_scaffold316G00610 [Cucumis melo var. makuwa]|uniref:Uncharacterized protein n=1 Tax=Cucumis melo var. makuwa TaxID=1194695 RepID=A0A5A7TVN0_CUCMM|nr:hypothetical protein E6C27_scaffold316G00610 [Cucumis melo var. makuwa]
MVKGRKVDFGPDAINKLYGLEDNEIGHAIFKNSFDRDKPEALEKVAWKGTKCDIRPTENLEDPLADQRDESTQDQFEDFICDPLAFIDDAFKGSEDATLSPVGSPKRKPLKKAVDNPLQKRIETTSKIDGKTSLSSPSKQT